MGTENEEGVILVGIEVVVVDDTVGGIGDVMN